MIEPGEVAPPCIQVDFSRCLTEACTRRLLSFLQWASPIQTRGDVTRIERPYVVRMSHSHCR